MGGMFRERCKEFFFMLYTFNPFLPSPRVSMPYGAGLPNHYDGLILKLRDSAH